jgi:hypothetical protein
LFREQADDSGAGDFGGCASIEEEDETFWTG